MYSSNFNSCPNHILRDPTPLVRREPPDGLKDNLSWQFDFAGHVQQQKRGVASSPSLLLRHSGVQGLGEVVVNLKEWIRAGLLKAHKLRVKDKGCLMSA